MMRNPTEAKAPMMLFETVFQDLRYGVRGLRRHAGFAAMSILALALGIGVNTAVFTAYKAIIARPIDGRDSDRLVNVSLRLQSDASNARFSYADYTAYRDHLRSFSGVIAASVEELRLTDAGGAAGRRSAENGSLMGRLGLTSPSMSNSELASTSIVSENYFAVLGVAPVRGRAFDAFGPSELASSPSVLISENFWQRRFASDPTVVGKIIRLNGAAFTIVGITPANFTGNGIAVPNFWLPLSLYPLIHPGSDRLTDREDLCCRVFGRLAPGVTMSEAQAETTVLASQLRVLHEARSELRKEVSAVISPGSPLPGINASLRLTIVLIMAAAVLVLVIACANAAGLQLARATARQQELGMRLSLGASRSRLIRQLVTESVLLGLLAGALALPLTWSILHLAVTQAAEALPAEFTLILDVNPDLGVFAYVLAISVLAGVVFGLAPAIAASRSALFSITRGTGTSFGRSRLRHGLIAAQVAVSLTLMIAGGLLVRSASQALRMDTGYDGEHVIDLSLQFPEDGTYTAEYKAGVARDVRRRLLALPGVTAVTNARAPNDAGRRRAAVSLNGEEPWALNRHATLYYTWVQPNYFAVLGIPLSRGEGFRTQAGQPERVAILSESAAQRLWPGENPIGRSVRLGTDRQFHEKGELLPDGPIWQVIGVARDTRGGMLDGSDSQQVYIPLPDDRVPDYPMLVRTHADPTLAMRAMEPMIAAVDPRLTASASTLQAMLRRSDAFLAASLSAAIATSISMFGLLLVAMGIFSTVSYDVVLRAREVGIRLAIGAQRHDVVVLMLRGSLRPVMVGLLLGIVLAVGASRLLRGVLYGLGVVDLVSFAGASLLFLTIALAASWLPARRALRVDPLVALRDQ
jgi:macrolide transport system ATP-binding/permease protein